MGSGLILVTF